MEKKLAERAHAKKRALERFSISYNKEVRREIISTIKAGAAILLRKQSNRVSLWKVQVAGQDCKVAYDKHRKEIITFLPLGEIELEKQRLPASPPPPSGIDTEYWLNYFKKENP